MTGAGSLPLYQQISERLVREIAAGRLADGTRLPPEREMAAELGVAVGTLRKALAELEGQGLLDRVQGSGNYIRVAAGPRGLYAFFRLELAEGGGGLPTAEVLSVERLVKPAGLPGFGTGAEGHRIRRLRRVDGLAAAVEEIWLDGDRAARLQADELSESLYLHYRRRLGLRITRVEDRIGVEPVPDWVPAAFALAPGMPAGHILRLGWDQAGKGAEVSLTWFDHRRVRYVARAS